MKQEDPWDLLIRLAHEHNIKAFRKAKVAAAKNFWNKHWLQIATWVGVAIMFAALFT